MKNLFFILITIFIISCTKDNKNNVTVSPSADFTSSTTSIVFNESINFTDKSINQPTSWTWTFEGGTPNSSTEKNPIVQYKIPGKYGVVLTVSNNAGSNSITKTEYITVGNGFKGGWIKVAVCALSDYYNLNYSGNYFTVNGSNIFITNLQKGIYCSNDNGTNWHFIKHPNNPNEGFLKVEVIGANILATTNCCIHVSTDNGTTWNPTLITDYEEMIGVWNINNITWAMSYSNHNYTDLSNTLYKSTDNGLHWVTVSKIPASEEASGSFAFANNTYWVSTSKGLYYSNDNCQTWNFKNTIYPVHDIVTINKDIYVLSGFSFATLKRSTDNGNTWNDVVINQSITSVGIFGNLYTANNLLFWDKYISKDSGLSFIDISDGIGVSRTKIINSYIYVLDIRNSSNAIIWKRSLTDFN